MAVSIALVVVTASAAGWLAAVAVVIATAVSMAWNGLSFTIAAELGGRRSGAAIGLQQTVLAASGVGAPVAFAALVSWTSWQAAFAVAALFPLAGRLLLQRFDEPQTRRA
jgi:MFS family permease